MKRREGISRPGTLFHRMRRALSREKRIGVALGGGGARGISHIAFLSVLEELDIRPATVTGTSIGAMIGSLYCSGMKTADILEEFKKLSGILDWASLLDIQWGNMSGVIKGDKIEKKINSMLPVKDFEELQIPLKIVATEFWTHSLCMIRTGSLAPAVRASISIPGIFRPVVRGNRVLIDGGSVDPLAYEHLKPESNFTIAVDVTGQKTLSSPDTAPPHLFECIMGSFQIMQMYFIENKLRNSSPDIYVKPLLNNIGLLDFHRADDIMESVSDTREQFKKVLKKAVF